MIVKTRNEIVDAFLSGKSYKKGNYYVFVENDCVRLVLFSSTIAKRNKGQDFFLVSNQGWVTNTTTRALNMLPGVRAKTKKGYLYINDIPADEGVYDELGEYYLMDSWHKIIL